MRSGDIKVIEETTEGISVVVGAAVGFAGGEAGAMTYGSAWAYGVMSPTQ
ncbi:MAG TPA: hypothetical protein VEQ66_14030 [Propionibacteriaceae bacterium]|nr:hypothetical protein [Propionibacteriaceae bacterium]